MKAEGNQNGFKYFSSFFRNVITPCVTRKWGYLRLCFIYDTTARSFEGFNLKKLSFQLSLVWTLTCFCAKAFKSFAYVWTLLKGNWRHESFQSICLPSFHYKIENKLFLTWEKGRSLEAWGFRSEKISKNLLELELLPLSYLDIFLNNKHKQTAYLIRLHLIYSWILEIVSIAGTNIYILFKKFRNISTHFPTALSKTVKTFLNLHKFARNLIFPFPVFIRIYVCFAHKERVFMNKLKRGLGS